MLIHHVKYAKSAEEADKFVAKEMSLGFKVEVTSKDGVFECDSTLDCTLEKWVEINNVRFS